MDLNLVYTKTAAGEQAVKDRTRLVKRNLRNVLIMVDGHSTVEELSGRIGKGILVESALEQLERDGLIEPGLEQTSVWDKGLKVAGRIRDVASEKLFGLRGQAPVAEPEPVPEPESDLELKLKELEETLNEPAPAPAPVRAPASQVPAASPFASPQGPAPSPFAPPSPSPATPSHEKPAGRFLQGYFKRGTGKAGADRAAAGDIRGTDKIEIKPVRPGPGWKPGLYGGLGIVIGALLVVGAVGVLVFPYGKYQAEIEAGLSKALGQRVTIGAVRGGLAPAPVLVFDRVQIGDAGEIELAEVRASPALRSLLGGPRVFRELAVSGVKIPADRLSALLPGLARLARLAPAESFAIEHMTISRAEISLRDFVLADLSGEFAVVDPGRQSHLSLATADGSLRLELAARETDVAVSLEAGGWKPVAGSPFVWDAVAVRGTLSAASLSGAKLEGRLFDGVVQGQMRFDWGSAGVALRADFGVERASARRVLDGLGAGGLIDGEVSGRVRVAAKADSVAALRERAVLEGEFVALRSVVKGLDFVEAVRRGTKAPTPGGTTRFDQLSGSWAWNGQLLRMKTVEGVSGVLQTSGNLSVAAGQKVAGSFDVRVKGAAADLRMPVELSGTLKDPQLRGAQR